MTLFERIHGWFLCQDRIRYLTALLDQEVAANAKIRERYDKLVWHLEDLHERYSNMEKKVGDEFYEEG